MDAILKFRIKIFLLTFVPVFIITILIHLGISPKEFFEGITNNLFNQANYISGLSFESYAQTIQGR